VGLKEIGISSRKIGISSPDLCKWAADLCISPEEICRWKADLYKSGEEIPRFFEDLTKLQVGLNEEL